MNVRIRGIEVASHKFDESEPPNYCSMNVEVGGVPLRLFLQQEQIDALVAAAEPIMMEVLRDVGEAMNHREAGDANNAPAGNSDG